MITFSVLLATVSTYQNYQNLSLLEADTLQLQDSSPQCLFGAVP